MHFNIFFNEMFLNFGVPTFRGQNVVKHGDHGVSHSCLLIELGPICNYMAKFYGSDLRVVRTTAYSKAIMEVYGKTFTGLDTQSFYGLRQSLV